MPQKQKLYLITLTTLTAVFAFAFYSYSAWNPPTADPTGNNAPSPLNVSGTGQIKVGGLTLNTGGAPNGLLVPNGNVGIGTTNPQAQLDVGFNNGSGIRLGSNTQMQAVSWHNSTVINNNLYYDGDGSVDDPANYRYISSAGDFNNAGAQLFIKGNGGEGGVRFNFRTAPTSTGANTAPASLIDRFSITSTHAHARNNFYVDGNVGIGTTSPEGKLHVQDGSTKFRMEGDRLTLQTVNGDPQFPYIAWHDRNGTRGMYLGWGQLGSHLNLNLENGNNLAINGGNVGIGTTSPGHPLHVVGRIQATGDICTGLAGGTCLSTAGGGNKWAGTDNTTSNIGRPGNVGIGTTSPGTKLDVVGVIRSKDGSDYVRLSAHDSSNLSQIVWGDDTNDRFRFYFDYWDGTANDREVLTLRSSGNVGISNTNPSYKLHVAGDIYANGGWVRVSGNQGIYFQSYGGGWYMTDTSWIRAYANKNILTGGQMRASTLYATNQVCIRGVCRTAWPSGSSGGNKWNGTDSTSSHIWRPGSVDIDNSLWANFITSEGGALIRAAVRGDGCAGTSGSASNCLHLGTGAGGWDVKVNDDLWVDDKLEVGGHTRLKSNIYFDGDIKTNVYTTGYVAAEGNITTGGYLWADTHVYAHNGQHVDSDLRLKEDIAHYNNSLDKILQLEPSSFVWKKSGEQDVGFIAQDVEEIFPEFVGTNPQTGSKTLQYSQLITPTIGAIQELKLEKDKQIQLQQEQIDFLKLEIEKLKAEIEELKK